MDKTYLKKNLPKKEKYSVQGTRPTYWRNMITYKEQLVALSHKCICLHKAVNNFHKHTTYLFMIENHVVPYACYALLGSRSAMSLHLQSSLHFVLQGQDSYSPHTYYFHGSTRCLASKIRRFPRSPINMGLEENWCFEGLSSLLSSLSQLWRLNLPRGFDGMERGMQHSSVPLCPHLPTDFYFFCLQC